MSVSSSRSHASRVFTASGSKLQAMRRSAAPANDPAGRWYGIDGNTHLVHIELRHAHADRRGSRVRQ
jgi:hypothetical protein